VVAQRHGDRLCPRVRERPADWRHERRWLQPASADGH
jgi:hypothetical protein